MANASEDKIQRLGPRGGRGPEARAGKPASSRPTFLRQARAKLRKSDPVMARLINERPKFDPRAWMDELPAMDLYGALLFQVTGQELSVPATRRTIGRIEDLFGGHLPSPAELLHVDPAEIRAAGLSWRKIGTLRALAERCRPPAESTAHERWEGADLESDHSGASVTTAPVIASSK